MRTLIELYDERPLENVLATQVFKPERTVFICEKNIADDPKSKRDIVNYLALCGVKSYIVMMAADRYSAKGMLHTLRSAVKRYPDCVLDITGGTDQALFAAGMLSAESDLPVFTWARRSNTFYSVNKAPFGASLPNPLSLTIEDFFVMAGGSVRKGRVDNSVLKDYLGFFKPFFDVYLRFKKEWTSIISWMQRASAPIGSEVSLSVSSAWTVRGERGVMTDACPEALEAFRKMGFIKDLETVRGESVRFRFRDLQVRTWLRDIGSVLETYIYKVCLDTELFTDVATSVVVDWEGSKAHDGVSNELDVMAARGVVPVFISCKTCEVKTEALNELSILKERFGGEMARAAIVTASKVQAVTRARAGELGIEVIDLEDLRTGRASERIKQLVLRK